MNPDIAMNWHRIHGVSNHQGLECLLLTVVQVNNKHIKFHIIRTFWGVPLEDFLSIGIGLVMWERFPYHDVISVTSLVLRLSWKCTSASEATTNSMCILEVKLTFEMLTVRGQQHSFSTHGGSCESVKGFETENVSTWGGTRTPSLWIHAECLNRLNHLSYQGQTFAVPCCWILALAV